MGGNNSKPKKGPTSSAKMSDQKKFIDDALKAHNSYRARHQVASLSHNKDLSAHAQKWAEHLAARDQFQHSDCNYKGERVGENIAMKWSSEPAAYTGQEATDQWYSEIKLHQTFGARTSPSGTGHFTQVVWKGSKELGVGRAMTKDNKVIVVANYRPAGNFVGDYAANVLPPKDGKIVLPPEPENKPMRMAYSSDKDGGSGSGGMKSFEDMKKEMFGRHGGDSRGFSSGGGGGESRSTRTYTHTEGSGSNKVTKIVTEETIIKSNGEKIINKTEKVIRGDTCSGSTDHSNGSAGYIAGHTGTFSDSLTRCTCSDNTTCTTANDKSSRLCPAPLTNGTSRNSRTTSGGVFKSYFHLANRPRRMSDFHNDCLQAHNSKRALHGLDALVLASDLNEHAQQWAEKLANEDKFEHSQCKVGSSSVGENIACSWSSAGADYTGDQVVTQWYDEIKKHDFSSDGAMGSGHFTQVVWKGSKELGVGKVKASNGKCIVVCNYRPAGNMMGTYKDNVFPPK